jgi:bacterioferritin (cytochrome b1)
MKGNREIIDWLDGLLTNELIAIDQCFVQARMLEN